MDKRIFKLSVSGFIFVGIVGSISHFVFEWCNYNRLAGAFFPVNESTWEHLKLLFFPYLIWSVAEYFLSGKMKGFVFAKAIGVIAGMITITSLFYTYSGATGKNNSFIDIAIFFTGVFVSFLTDYILIKSFRKSDKGCDLVGTALFLFTLIAFILFTYYPPFIPLFRDPINLSYGI